MNALRRIRDEERGSVAIIVAGFLTTAILLMAWVLDFGQGAEHRRQLQLMADAGALAAAQDFIGCTGENADDPESPANKAIRDAALEYATAQNLQVGGDEAQERVNFVINGTDYDAEDYSDGTPCETGFVDVKLVEEDSPPFVDIVGPNDWHGHARVQLFKLDQLGGLLPLALPVPDPKNAAAIFVDEATGLPLKTVPLKKTGREDNLAIWETNGAAEVPIGADHVGLRIALSGSSSTACDAPSVTCYDGLDPNAGLVHIQGWSGAGSVSQSLPNGGQDAPLARSVRLVPGTDCDDPYFSSPKRRCTRIGVSAIVDFGGDPSNVGGDLVAIVNEDEEYELSPDASNPATGAWTTGTVIPVPEGAGPLRVELKWTETKGKVAGTDCTKKNKPCEGFLGGVHGFVQRHFSATEGRSGPVELVELSEGATKFPNSLQRCDSALTSCDHPLKVKIGISGTLAVGGPGQYLRLGQDNALDCNNDGNGNFKDEVALGCTVTYAVNEGAACPDAEDLDDVPQPWICSAWFAGEREAQAAQGLNERILGDDKPDDCPPAGAFGHNNWDLNRDGATDYVDGDPRIVYVYLTSFGAFATLPSDLVPVTGFAAFYITAWKGTPGPNGIKNPCEGHGDDDPDPGLQAGEVYGHFISHVEIPNEGGGGLDPCDFDDLRPCTAVLVD